MINIGNLGFRIKFGLDEKGVFTLNAMPDTDLTNDDIGQGVHEDGRTGEPGFQLILVSDIRIQAGIGIRQDDANIVRIVLRDGVLTRKQEFCSEESELAQTVHLVKFGITTMTLSVEPVGKFIQRTGMSRVYQLPIEMGP